jgi:hypothetical protein
MQTNPAGGKQKWLVGMNLCHSDTIGVHFILYDRLLHCGGMSGTVTTAQNCGGSITRYTDGLGNKIWLEIYTTVGATPQTVTAIYVNENGATHTTQATAIGGATLDKTQSRIIALPLQAGDRGVKSVTSVTLSGSTGTAGNFGVTIAHPLCTTMFGIVSGLERIFDGYPSAIEILTDACLGIAEFGARGIIPNVYGQISFVEA